MTINKVMERLAEHKPHTYDSETVAGWIITLEKDICHYIVGEDKELEYPDNADDELTAGGPFEDIYELYCEAQIDRLNREFGQYANSYAVFNSVYSDFSKDWLRHHRPVSAGPVRIW